MNPAIPRLHPTKLLSHTVKTRCRVFLTAFVICNPEKLESPSGKRQLRQLLDPSPLKSPARFQKQQVGLHIVTQKEGPQTGTPGHASRWFTAPLATRDNSREKTNSCPSHTESQGRKPAANAGGGTEKNEKQFQKAKNAIH